MRSTSTTFPLATALRAAIPRYTPKILKDDLVAGLVVSLVALPLAMALAIAVGLPPRHGLYTAIVAGVVAGIFGGSMVQVSGPTAAFVVIVAPIVRDFGLHGLIWCEIMAGIMLLVMGFARLGKLIHYVPYPVVLGFTAGIAVTIATLALNDLFGLGIVDLKGAFVQKALMIFAQMPQTDFADLAVGLATLCAIFLFPKVSTKIPAPAAGILVGLLVSWALTSCGFHIETLNTRFSYTDAAGVLQQGIQPYPPVLHYPGDGDNLFALPTYKEFRLLFHSALVVAALAALESLLSASVADSMTRTRHDPNAELNGIGLANIFSGLAAGIPATGAIARTAANIQAGGKTPVAAITHALLILLYVVTLAPWISYTPMAALAALLIFVSWRMAHFHQLARIVQIAPRSDIVVLLTCFTLTVFIDMVAGVTVGMVMASLLFMTRVAEATHLHVSEPGKPDIAHGDLPEGTMVYRMEGPLFFGSIDKMLEGAEAIPDSVNRLVIDLMHVPVIDMTGMVGMKTFLLSVARPGRDVAVCGHKDVTERIRRKIAGTAFAAHVHMESSVRDALKA